MQENWDFTHLAKSANCLGSDRSRPGIPPTGIFFPEIEVKTSCLCAYFGEEEKTNKKHFLLHLSCILCSPGRPRPQRSPRHQPPGFRLSGPRGHLKQIGNHFLKQIWKSFLKQIWKSLFIFSNRFVNHDDFHYISSSQGHMQQICKSFFATKLLIIIGPTSHHIALSSAADL